MTARRHDKLFSHALATRISHEPQRHPTQRSPPPLPETEPKGHRWCRKQARIIAKDQNKSTFMQEYPTTKTTPHRTKRLPYRPSKHLNPIELPISSASNVQSNVRRLRIEQVLPMSITQHPAPNSMSSILLTPSQVLRRPRKRIPDASNSRPQPSAVISDMTQSNLLKRQISVMSNRRFIQQTVQINRAASVSRALLIGKS